MLEQTISNNNTIIFHIIIRGLGKKTKLTEKKFESTRVPVLPCYSKLISNISNIEWYYDTKEPSLCAS